MKETEMRRSTREHRPVERLDPSMKGKSYLQSAKEGRKLEYCHNLITQSHPNDESYVEYEYGLAMLIARAMAEFQDRISVQGASFAQQYILQKGLKKFGERGARASSKEMDQLHRRNCFTPISVKEMTPSERKKAMEALMFLMEKRDGSIKG